MTNWSPRWVIVVWTQRTRRSSGGWLLCEPKGPGDHQSGDCCVKPKDQEITMGVSGMWTLRTKRLPGGDCCVNPEDQAGDCCVNPKDQEITRRMTVVWTQRTGRSPGAWLLCEPKGPGDHQVGNCCLYPKDQDIMKRVIAMWTQRTRRSPGGWLLQNLCLWTWLQSPHNLSFLLADYFRKVVKEMFPDSETVIVVWTQRIRRPPGRWLLCEPKEPGDHQAGDYCVNPKDQEITRWVIVAWSQRTRRSPGRWLLCEHKGPGDHQTGDWCVNPEDQEITRRVIVAESLFVNMVAEPTQPFLSAGRPFQESREGHVSR